MTNAKKLQVLAKDFMAVIDTAVMLKPATIALIAGDLCAAVHRKMKD